MRKSEIALLLDLSLFNKNCHFTPHVITKKDVDRNGNERLQTFSGLFINYLKEKQLWNEELTYYTFGLTEENLAEANNSEEIHTILQEQFISTAKEDHNLHLMTKQGLLWDTTQEQAIEKGNLIHGFSFKRYSISNYV